MCSGSRAAKRRRDAEAEAAAAQAAEDKRSRYELALERANQAAELARKGPQGGGSDDTKGIGADDEDEELQRNLLKVPPLPSPPSATPFSADGSARMLNNQQHTCRRRCDYCPHYCYRNNAPNACCACMREQCLCLRVCVSVIQAITVAAAATCENI